jgi:L-2-hydroxyglutarate oxidase LhgO
MSDETECVVVGAGVVGLAVARRLALDGREVVVLEAEGAVGTVTSARNSEVIHAGLYYPDGSLKARLCRRGRDLLYRYLDDHGIDHRRCGKLIVATDDGELAALDAVAVRALANGVDDLERLDGAAAAAMEPGLRCRGALFSPSTGIFDSHAYMLSLQGEAEAAGAVIALKSPLVRGAATEHGLRLAVGGAEPATLGCRWLVNCAGLGAQAVAAAVDGVPAATIPPLHLAKGSYFALSGPAPFRRLVYPVPGPASLGTHYTRDLGGQGRFGPDVEWVDRMDYAVDPGRAASFYASIRRYWPDLPEGSLEPAYAGIRPKLQAPGAPAADFVIQGPEVHGVSGLVNLFGIESPGLTASLAIADEVAARMEAGR